MEGAEWRAEFYIDERGRSPVEEFLKNLDHQTQSRVYRVVNQLEESGGRLTMPLARPLTGYRFWELRVQSGRKNVRIFYFSFTGRRIILLHGFMKKSQETPRRELQTAARRLAEVLGGNNE